MVAQIIILAAVFLIITIIFSVIFKDKSKVDKGFKLFYFGLSYRRKLIRALTSFPIIVLAIVVIFLFTDLSMQAKLLVVLLSLILFVFELIYNFYMWKKKES